MMTMDQFYERLERCAQELRHRVSCGAQYASLSIFIGEIARQAEVFFDDDLAADTNPVVITVHRISSFMREEYRPTSDDLALFAKNFVRAWEYYKAKQKNAHQGEPSESAYHYGG